MSELDLGLPPPPGERPRRAFYAGTAMSTNAVQEYGTPLPLFDAICRWHAGDALSHEAPRPWLDPFASAWNALVPTYYSLEGGGGVAVDGLKQSWRPPPEVPSASRFVVFNPVYEESENACAPRCKKKTCVQRGFCLSEYKPGMGDTLLKAESEALEWGGPIYAVLPARQAGWFRRAIHPPARRFLVGRAWPTKEAPAARFMSVTAQEEYTYEGLTVTTVRLAERQAYRVPPGATRADGAPVREDSAGFDTLLIVWRGHCG